MEKSDWIGIIIIALLIWLLGFAFGIVINTDSNLVEYILNSLIALGTIALAIIAFKGASLYKNANIHKEILSEHKSILDHDKFREYQKELVFIVFKLSYQYKSIAEINHEIDKERMVLHEDDVEIILKNYERFKVVYYEVCDLENRFPVMISLGFGVEEYKNYRDYITTIFMLFSKFESVRITSKNNINLKLVDLQDFEVNEPSLEFNVDEPDIKNLCDFDNVFKVIKKLGLLHKLFLSTISEIVSDQIKT